MSAERLAEIAAEIQEMKFSYKVEGRKSPDYWKGRAGEFARYSAKAAEYYTQAYLMIKQTDGSEAGVFLLYTGKFGQIASKLLDTMEKIGENPSVMNSDRQQSRWSREIRDQLVRHSDVCLRQEKDMNDKFRRFCQKHLVGKD
ncbi:MAG: hypothetical protein EB829_05965 [Nitrosopumilus sp. H8]|nr:MAG: hypothetical protein EB830_01810 [Nitrosopumilus sp. H13]RNJ77923.1 MAG: hypothetical protein EB829_05965 [Nitrosopumilus sp. H8]